MQDKNGFTIIEIIVVIAIISVLSAIVSGNVVGFMSKARDARRVVDTKEILKALMAYHAQYGCIPITQGSTCLPEGSEFVGDGVQTWDYSSIGDFLPFLVDAGIMGRVPVDPINNEVYRYRYYCYYSGSYGLLLQYYKETGTGGWIVVNNQIGGTPRDTTFICK